MQKHIETRIADKIIRGEVSDGDEITIDLTEKNQANSVYAETA